MVVHRDLKSANVFLANDGTFKLGDLNVSKVAKQGLVYTQTGTPCISIKLPRLCKSRGLARRTIRHEKRHMVILKPNEGRWAACFTRWPASRRPSEHLRWSSCFAKSRKEAMILFQPNTLKIWHKLSGPCCKSSHPCDLLANKY